MKWEKESANFEAEFEIGETDQSVVYDATKFSWNWNQIKVDELPSAVKDYVSKNYRGVKIKEATKITDAKELYLWGRDQKTKIWSLTATGNSSRKRLTQTRIKTKWIGLD